MTLSSSFHHRNTRSDDTDLSCTSRTRSSSRTTSGNTSSSRYVSRSPSVERRGTSEDLKNKRRFLQRWDDDCTKTRDDKDKLPYIYQQAEFIRISQDIIRKCNAEDELISFLTDLDNGNAIDLNKIKDLQLKKKLRHLSKALYLKRDGNFFSKPEECNISLLDVFQEFSSFIKFKISSKKPYKRKEVQVQKLEEGGVTEDMSSTVNGPELMSLRELHEQGFYVDYENIQREFIKNINSWMFGVRPLKNSC